MNCLSSIKFQGKVLGNLLKPSFDGLIAPSRNLLTKNAFAQRKQSVFVDEKIQRVVENQQLFFSPVIDASLPLSEHCVSMSLHFLKNYRTSHDLKAAALSMKDGCDTECGKTSLFYNQLFEENAPTVFSFEEQCQYLHHVRETTANTLDLMFSEEIAVNKSLPDILSYMKNELPSGEYIIPLQSHVIALVKDEQGSLYVFDSNQGTLDLKTEGSKKYFQGLLKKHRIHLHESLLFMKVSQLQENLPYNSTWVEYDDDDVKLTYEKGEDKWGTAVFKWRGKTYRFPWDSENNHIYNDDPKSIIRAKCLLLVPKTLVDATCRTVYHTVLTALNVLTLPLARVKSKRNFLHQIIKIKRAAQDIFRSPLFGVAGSCLALYGLFKPLDARKYYGRLERRLNRQNARVIFAKKYYSARCFVPLNFGSNDEEVTIRMLKKQMLFKNYHNKKWICF